MVATVQYLYLNYAMRHDEIFVARRRENDLVKNQKGFWDKVMVTDAMRDDHVTVNGYWYCDITQI